MRRILAVLGALLGAFGLAACGASIRHAPRDIHPAGAALPVEVSLRGVGDEPVSGVVHFRASPAAPYSAAEMARRAHQLWTLLPTEALPPDTVVEYYIDVAAGDELLALASPGLPFHTTLLDRTAFILANLRAVAYASDELNDVEIVLDTNGSPVEAPEIEYVLPNIPGVITAAMDPAGRHGFRLRVPPDSVIPGIWRYALVLRVDGQEFRIPETGFASFEVARAPRPHQRDPYDGPHDPHDPHGKHPATVGDVIDIVIEKNKVTDGGSDRPD